MQNSSLLEIDNLKKFYPITAGIFHRQVGEIKAVDGVSFSVHNGETLGLVGESGCGKSTLGRVIVKLEAPTAGSIHFQSRDITFIDRQEQRKIRRDIQIIFQDPQSSLDPRMTVGDSLEEALLLVDRTTEAQKQERIRELLGLVGLASEYADRYPHEFSGGEKQRIGIARALAVNPKLVVADEPVSALDVSIQAQIINLLMDLKERFGVAYIVIAHDLSVIKHISDRVAVMYLGKIMEIAPKQDLFAGPLHPYTQALLSAIYDARLHSDRQPILLSGDVPSASRIPPGCRFHTRCFRVMPICPKVVPVFAEIAPGHFTACHLYPACTPPAETSPTP
ncbi:MAG: ATP-binding cassette domain-containing protein [Chloroflexi bacterium]|nr:ATP-binding cassette domain-containing protein [Chloroflexota bacterium]